MKLRAFDFWSQRPLPSGVRPRSSLMRGLAPCCSSTAAASHARFDAAMCSGVPCSNCEHGLSTSKHSHNVEVALLFQSVWNDRESPHVADSNWMTSKINHQPTHLQTNTPTNQLTYKPTHPPTNSLTNQHTHQPTHLQTKTPTNQLTYKPTHPPTNSLINQHIHQPTHLQTKTPTNQLTYKPKHPPTNSLTNQHTHQPTHLQTKTPTNQLTYKPKHPRTNSLTNQNTHQPTHLQTNTPTSRLQNVNGGHSGTLAFYFCLFWGACRQVTRACRQDYFFVVDI